MPPGRARLATRPVPTGSPADREHDRDDRCRLLCREDAGGAVRDNDIDLEPDELGGDLGEALAASLRPAILDRDGATLDPTEFAQPLHESGDPLAVGRRRARAQEPDGRQLAGLLRARRERPRRRRAAEKRDELAAFHSITSSARASSCGWNVEAERLGGLEVDDQLDLCGLDHRQVCRLLALENAAHIDAGLAKRIRQICSIAHQAADFLNNRGLNTSQELRVGRQAQRAMLDY